MATTDLIVHEVSYEVTLADITARFSKYRGLSATTAEGYEMVRLALSDLRGCRSRIEARRVELKRDALEYGRKVDTVARQLSDAIEVIEQPLKVEKGKIDDEKARIKAEREAAERAEAEAKLRAEREVEEARLRAAREAEEQRLREERAAFEAEQKAAAAERERHDQARRAEEDRLRQEREKLEAEKRDLDEQKRQAEREEFQRQARSTAEREATERVERERAEAESKRREEEERQRLEAMRPDVERLAALAGAIRAVSIPTVGDGAARDAVEVARRGLQDVAARLEGWARDHQVGRGA
jgi:chromosome segregation ATPase